MWISRNERKAYKAIVDVMRRAKFPLRAWDIYDLLEYDLQFSIGGYMSALEKAGVVKQIVVKRPPALRWKLRIKTGKPFLRVEKACYGSGLYHNEPNDRKGAKCDA